MAKESQCRRRANVAAGQDIDDDALPSKNLEKNINTTDALVDGTSKEATVNQIRDQAMELSRNLSIQLERDVISMMERLISEVEARDIPPKYKKFLEDTGKKGKKRFSASGVLPEKEFIPRESLLTNLFEINHMQTVYNIFIATMMVLCINSVVEEWVVRGNVNLNFDLIYWAFDDFRTVLMVWVGIMIMTCLAVYPGFYFWSHHRLTLGSRRKILLWDLFWLTAYATYFSLIIYIPLMELVRHKLPPASAVTLLMEQVRFLMKTHAFVRSNVPQAIHYGRVVRSTNTNRLHVVVDDDAFCPDFSKFLYFLFAPTLIYRNSYPRTQKIRWRWVFGNFAQVLGVLFYLYFIFVRFCVPVFQQIGREPLTPKALVLSVFGCMMPGTLVLLSGFFLLLHSWLNAFAEMLCFADRMFYEDWWNSHTYATYYRTWNVVVHDWLYTYVYKDVHELCGRRTRFVPMMAVFVMSAIVHEFIITFTLGYFYPVVLLMFGGIGFFLTFVTNIQRRLGNIFMWLTLFIGTGLIMSLQSIEWYARVNCPPSLDGLADFLVPRSWTCLKFT